MASVFGAGPFGGGPFGQVPETVVDLVGFEATAQLGTLLFGSGVSLVGFSATAVLGTLTLTGDGGVTLVGFSSPASLGMISPAATPQISIPLLGFSAAPALGVLGVVNHPGTIFLTGFECLVELGILTPLVVAGLVRARVRERRLLVATIPEEV